MYIILAVVSVCHSYMMNFTTCEVSWTTRLKIVIEWGKLTVLNLKACGQGYAEELYLAYGMICETLKRVTLLFIRIIF